MADRSGRCITYHGRPPNSASSTGNKVQHYNEYNDIITSIFGQLTEANKQRLADIIKQQQEKALKESSASLAKAKAEKAKAEAAKADKEPKAAGIPVAQDVRQGKKGDAPTGEALLAPAAKPTAATKSRN
ncbi:hypothetical protein ACLKA6_004677 [Drosophila palustris]